MDGIIYTGPIPWEQKDSPDCFNCLDHHCPRQSTSYINCPIEADEIAATIEETTATGWNGE